MRGKPIPEQTATDTFRITPAMLRKYMHGHHLKDTAANRKKAKNALKKAHDRHTNPPGKEITVQESAADWQIIYGRQRVGGVFTYVSTADDTSVTPNVLQVYLLLVVTIAAHECNKIVGVYFDDVLVNFDGEFTASQQIRAAAGAYSGYVDAQVNLGEESQAALSKMIEWSSGDWDSNCRQAGCTHIGFRLRYNENIFPNGLPTISFLVEGKKVELAWDAANGYDVGFSRNPALCLMDFMLNTKFGAGRYSTSLLTLEQLATQGGQPIAMTNDNDLQNPDDTQRNDSLYECDESVDLLAGGTESRYTLDSTFKSSEGVGSIIDKMLSAFGGQLVFQANAVNILVAKFRTPVGTITTDDLLSEVKINVVESSEAYYGKIGGTYIDPNKGYEETDFPPVIFKSYLNSGSTPPDLPDPYEDREDISLPCTASPSMAMRLAKIEMYRSKFGMRCSFRARFNTYKYSAGDNLFLPFEFFGWDALNGGDGKIFEVQSTQPIIDIDQNGAMYMAVQFEMKENDSDVTAWTTEEEKGVVGMPDHTFPDPNSPVVAPTNLAVTSLFGVVQLTWTAPDDYLVTHGGQIEVAYVRTGLWPPLYFAPSVSGDIETANITGLTAGFSYDLWIRSKRGNGAVSNWVTIANHTVNGTPTPGQAMGVLGLTYP